MRLKKARGRKWSGLKPQFAKEMATLKKDLKYKFGKYRLVLNFSEEQETK